jgi:group I intron endonuclease
VDVFSLYEIFNAQTGARYIGMTVNIKQRFGKHRVALRGGSHHCRHLQAAWDKYGEEVFVFRVTNVYDTLEELRLAEQAALTAEVGGDLCYNHSLGTYAPRHTGETRALISVKVNKAVAEGRGGKFIPTAETRQRMSEALKGNQNAKGHIRTEEHRQRLSEANLGNQNFLGKTHNDEARAKISAAKQGLPSHRKGQQMPEEFGRNISAGLKEYYAGNPHPMRGRAMSEETKAKISTAKKGRPTSAEHREKIRQARLGTKASDETRAKLSAMRKGKVRTADHAAAYNKAVIELTSGQVFPSLKAVKEHYGIAPGQLGEALKEDKPFKRGRFAGLHFRYVTPQPAA